jgi:hypothetical protein
LQVWLTRVKNNPVSWGCILIHISSWVGSPDLASLLPWGLAVSQSVLPGTRALPYRVCVAG